LQNAANFGYSRAASFFGINSFWSGVDFCGQALSNTIIRGLPLAVLDHPLIDAKVDLVRERGTIPFTGY